MQSESPVPPANDNPKGLPLVAPPSGRFIVQLFLVPGLIVAVAVLILLGFRYLVSGTQTPQEFLKKLDDPNPEVRWRGASELAQVLQRPESRILAADPKFGLDLAERLRRALRDMRQEEEATFKQAQGKSRRDREAAWHVHAPQRRYALFLTACLGDLIVPVGGPLLCDIATDDRGSDPKWKALRRRRAVWALANLGNNRGRFQELSAAEREAVFARLEREADGKGDRARWAAAALDQLQGKTGALRVDKALAECAEDRGDPFLRELVAFALKYWDGPDVEKTLVKLAHDPGEGEAVEVGEMD
jgi:HEAT repeat protein